MSNEIEVFNYNNSQVRTIQKDGDPWFVLKDVANILAVENHKDLAKRLEQDEVGRFELPHPQSPSKTVEMVCINESGLYNIILRSDKPEAKPFRKWVTSEVLPSIRKHGLYATEDLIANPDLAIAAFTALKEEREKRQLLEQKNSEQAKLITSQADTISVLEPKASYCDTVLKARNPITVTQIAKDYGMSAIRFNKLLKDLKIQYRSGDCWVLCQKYANNGYTKTSTISLDDQSAVIHTYWTQKGRLFLYDVLKKKNVLPVVEQIEV